WLGFITAGVALLSAAVLLSTASYVEWKIATHTESPVALPEGAVGLAFAIPAAAIALFAVATPIVLVYMTRARRSPLPVLASRARQIAAGERVSIPYQERENEIGDLAVALREWQD